MVSIYFIVVQVKIFFTNLMKVLVSKSWAKYVFGFRHFQIPRGLKLQDMKNKAERYCLE